MNRLRSKVAVLAGGALEASPSPMGRSKRRNFSLRRSVHFIPSNEKLLAKAASVGADTIVLDLEDSVKDKDAGRRAIRSFLDTCQVHRTAKSSTEILVRINPLSGEEWRKDLEVAFDGKVAGFMLPKVESAEELRMLDSVLNKLESDAPYGPPKVLLPIATETPLAVLNIAEIARGPRVCAITWGCEDLSAEIGSFATRKPNNEYLDIFRHCQNMCLLAAKAAGVQAIDGVYQDIRDMAGFERETNQAKLMGYDGKLSLHPEQVKAVHRVFQPTPEEIKEAREILDMWETCDGGTFEYKGKMIDTPHVVRARKVVARNANAADSHSSEVEGETTAEQDTSSQKITGQENEDEVFPRVYLGKLFEELVPGLKIRHFLTRTVTEADNVFFTCLTLNPAPIHLDHELSKDNSKALSGRADEGKPLFNSMFTLSLLVGMAVPETTHGTTVANLGFSEVVFPKPVFPGDTLRAETVVVDRRESKTRPHQGIVTLQHTAYNQRGEVVCKATRTALMKRR